MGKTNVRLLLLVTDTRENGDNVLRGFEVEEHKIVQAAIEDALFHARPQVWKGHMFGEMVTTGDDWMLLNDQRVPASVVLPPNPVPLEFAFGGPVEVLHSSLGGETSYRPVERTAEEKKEAAPGEPAIAPENDPARAKNALTEIAE